MNARQQKLVSRFGQVLTFLDQNQSTIPPTAIASQRQVLTTSVDQIGAFAQDQVLRGNEAVLAQTLTSARTSLRDTFMRQLSTVGLLRLTGKRPGDPDVKGAEQIFALPATRTNALTLIAAATSMLTAATAYPTIFSTAGVDLGKVSAAIQALQAAADADSGAKRTAKGATQGIKDQIQAGRGAVRMMDVVIRPLLVSNKSLLTQWESVKRAAGGANLATPTPVAEPPAAGSTTANPQPTSSSTASTSA